MNYRLYYLIEQNGFIDGAKSYQGEFLTAWAAQDFAARAGVMHFSVESVDPDDGTICVVYIC